MARYFKINDFFGFWTITGPTSIYLLLDLRRERIEDPVVIPIFTYNPYCKQDDELVRKQILEGTDASNRDHHTAYHPWIIKFTLDEFSDGFGLLREAARAVVDRVAEYGESEYE